MFAKMFLSTPIFYYYNNFELLLIFGEIIMFMDNFMFTSDIYTIIVFYIESHGDN